MFVVTILCFEKVSKICSLVVFFSTVFILLCAGEIHRKTEK